MVNLARGTLAALAGVVLYTSSSMANPSVWRYEWPTTDFDKTSIDFRDIISGGPPKDGIPPIDDPQFRPVSEIDHLADTEPVIGLFVNGEQKAYPLQVLMWHEIVNDEIGGVPVTVTFCPLCNTTIVFDRRLDGRVLDFGTTGKLRFSDLVMYDRQTETWWQQFLGEAIVGELTGSVLKIIPARVESFANFKERAPNGLVLVPARERGRAYGNNPYRGYDSSSRPFLFRGALPTEVAPLSRVVVLSINGTREAWSLNLLREKRRVEIGDGIVIHWEPGQNSALDASVISRGVDIGNVTVIRETADGPEDVAYSVDFAFAFTAFFPDSPIHN
ncbi:MAG: DUF3179 domain-containing protein [Proteobacteria bacterium]|nr:DUF3179 domain-containing protein [Pseudomonadota bacterium]